jgi:hypothetical protein
MLSEVRFCALEENGSRNIKKIRDVIVRVKFIFRKYTSKIHPT